MSVNPARVPPPVGWPLMPVPDQSGSLNWPGLDTSVKQTIRALLVTRPGERLLHGQLGGGLQDFIHQPNTLVTRRRIHDRIAETLGRYEPRIALDRIEVEPDGAAAERVRITLTYRLRATGAPDALSVSVAMGG